MAALSVNTVPAQQAILNLINVMADELETATKSVEGQLLAVGSPLEDASSSLQHATESFLAMLSQKDDESKEERAS